MSGNIVTGSGDEDGTSLGAINRPTSVLPHICLPLPQVLRPPHPTPGCLIVPEASWHPRERPSLPQARRKTRLFSRNMRRRQVAGQGEVYGHSPGAPIVCLTPLGCPRGPVFTALSPWEQWPLQVSILLLPSCLPARGGYQAAGGHLPGTSHGKGNSWSLLLELHDQRKSPWWVGCFLFPSWAPPPPGGLSPSSPILGSGAGPPGWERILNLGGPASKCGFST